MFDPVSVLDDLCAMVVESNVLLRPLQWGMASPRGKRSGPRAAAAVGADTEFDVNPWILDVVVLPRSSLKLDNARSGNPRDPVEAYVEKLSQDMIKNPPGELNMVTWEDPGMASTGCYPFLSYSISLSRKGHPGAGRAAQVSRHREAGAPAGGGGAAGAGVGADGAVPAGEAGRAVRHPPADRWP